MDPPPFSPHGRFSVLTEALLGLLYTHTHRHIQTLRAQALHDRDPQGDLCISTMSYMGVGTPVCVSLFAVCDCACRHPAAVCMFYPAVYLLEVGASSGALVTSQILKRNCTTKISGSRFFHHF